MRSCCTSSRSATLLLLVGPVIAQAQNESNGSPYSSYGFGDLFHSTQVSSALMGGTGVAYTEQYGILPANPASYVSARYVALGGLERPVFEAGMRAVFLNQKSEGSSGRRSDADFTGFSLGVPFGKNRWGLAFGLTPFSDVGYSIKDAQPFDGGTVNYEYNGSGGLNRIFGGLAREIYKQRPDSAGNPGSRLVLGGNFDYLFGSIEQTRRAIYPTGGAFTNTSAFSSMVLNAPSATFGLHFSDDLISKAKIAETRKKRAERDQARVDRWKVEHVDTLRMPPDELARWRAALTPEERITWLRNTSWKVAYTDSTHIPPLKTMPEAQPWRWIIGATSNLPTTFNATSTDLVTTFFRGSTGIETVLDTIPANGRVKGSITVPVGFGVGLSVHNERWLATIEMRHRDWAGLKVNVTGYELPASLRSSKVYAAGVRFKPSFDGPFFARLTYRAGLRYEDDYLQVHDMPLARTSVSAGVSIPLNHLQYNSQFHIGAEYGQRGSLDDGLLQETGTMLWFGISLTPRRGRGEGDWFQRRQIQ